MPQYEPAVAVLGGAKLGVKSLMAGAVEMNERTSPEIYSAAILAWRAGAAAKVQSDFLAHEEPLEIRVRGRSVAVTMRSPGHDEVLAAGFLLTEGLLRRPGDVVEIAHCRQREAANDQNLLNVFLSP